MRPSRPSTWKTDAKPSASRPPTATCPRTPQWSMPTSLGPSAECCPTTNASKWTDERLAKKKFSCSTFMLYLGIEGRFDNVSHHTIYLAENYRENLLDIEQRHALSANPSFYVQNAGVTDPTLAPAGQSTLYVLLPVTHDTGSVDWVKKRLRAIVPSPSSR